jgi:hypothetical protein
MDIKSIYAQHAFDAVVSHLFRQGRRSYGTIGDGEATMCLYRSSDGLKCAVGALIPDELYRPSMEGEPSYGLFVPGLYSLPDWLRELPEGMLRGFQVIHDNWHNWSSTNQMRDQLVWLADRYGLSHTLVDALSFDDR